MLFYREPAGGEVQAEQQIPEAVQPEPQILEAVQPEPQIPEAVQPESQPDPQVPEAVQPEPQMPEAGDGGGSGDHSGSSTKQKDPMDDDVRFRARFKRKILRNDRKAIFYTGKASMKNIRVSCNFMKISRVGR